jgi:metal-responsive CopG/Arc/MetJ family transcriptional regulator
MPAAKIAISLDEGVLKEIDGLVLKKIYPNRSRVIQEAVRDKILRLSKSRLARECAKLNTDEEIGLAEEGMDTDVDKWPEY